MPRVHHVRARKDYPSEGIAKGEMYFKWSMKLQRGGITRRSKTRPRPSQMTTSEFKSAAFQIIESAEDFRPETFEDLEDFRQSTIDDLQTLYDETEEKRSNQEEAFPGGSPTLDMLQERVDAVQAVIDSLEGEDYSAENRGDTDEDRDEALETAAEEFRSLVADLEVY